LLSKIRAAAEKKIGAEIFLIDRGIIHKIMDAARLQKEDLVVEIGAGLGILTGFLAQRAGKVLAIRN